MECKYFPSENTNNLYCELTRIACYTALGYHGLKRQCMHTYTKIYIQTCSTSFQIHRNMFVYAHLQHPNRIRLLANTYSTKSMTWSLPGISPPTLRNAFTHLSLSLSSLFSGVFIINVIIMVQA